MFNTPEFQSWLDLEVHPENLLIEVREHDEWVRA